MIVLSRQALADLDRLSAFLRDSDPDGAVKVGRLIMNALALLEAHPFVGRQLERGLRELVISRGKTGYVALYRFDVSRGLVRVLALRHQREAGYQGS